MILRRLAEGVRQQDWFTVVVEVLIVVVGIFLGLQVDDWNEARKDRIDERMFITRLHGDILLAEKLSSSRLDRRLGRLESVITAADVLFARSEREVLSEDECRAVSATHYFNVSIPELPSLSELAGTGRMSIIRDRELRFALVELQPIRSALSTLIALQSARAIDLPEKYVDLIRLEAKYTAEDDEVHSFPKCVLAGMRANRAFLNDFSQNSDRYDAYVKDGLAPWSAQMDKIHRLVDEALGFTHGEEQIP